MGLSPPNELMHVIPDALEMNAFLVVALPGAMLSLLKIFPNPDRLENACTSYCIGCAKTKYFIKNNLLEYFWVETPR